MSHLLILLLLISIHITFSSIFRSFTNPFLKTKSSKSENDSLVVPIETQSANTTTSIPDIDSSPGKNTIKRDIVIIGSGPSGLTAAIYTGRALLKPLVVAGYEAGGQLMLTNDVENFPGYRHAVTGPELIADLTEQAKTFGAELWQTNCQYINTSVYPFELHLPNCTVTARAIIIATGADSIWLNALDEDQFKGKGISTCATCDGYIFRNKPIVVIGGGDSAMEEATFLTRFASSVTVIHRSESFRASKLMLKRAMDNPKIKFLTNTTVQQWLGTDGILSGAKLSNGTHDFEIECDGAFIAIGHRPNTKFLDQQLRLDSNGYIAPESHTMTNIPGIFACGDCADKRYKQAITAAGSGCQAAIDAERWLEEYAANEHTVSVDSTCSQG